MTYTPVTIPAFGGLNLRDDPQDIGFAGAVDLLNVDLDAEGRVRVRDGYDNLTTSAAAARYEWVYPYDIGTFAVLAIHGTTLESVDVSTGTASNLGAVGGLGARAVHFGTPSATRIYIADAGQTIKRIDSGTLSSPAGMPASSCIAVTPWDNRLVAANTGAAGGPGGAASSGSHVWFSDPGAPETWGANNYVQLTPGDNESITEIVSFDNYLFVFKQSRVFVFYATTTGAGGSPVFNYRVVSLADARVAAGAGSQTAMTPAACATPEGVAYISDAGIFLTSGGPPRSLSGALDPIFFGPGPNQSFTGGTFRSVGTRIDATAWCIASHRGRLYVTARRSGQSANDRVFVLSDGQWLLWDVPMAGLIGNDRDSYNDGLYFSYATGSNHLGKLTAAFSTDDGTAITSRYQTGFNDLGVPQQKVVRETILWGTGTPTVSLFTDHGTSDSNAAAVTLGTSPAVAEGRHRVAYRGHLYALKLSASSGQWAVNRATLNLRGAKPPGTKAT